MKATRLFLLITLWLSAGAGLNASDEPGREFEFRYELSAELNPEKGKVLAGAIEEALEKRLQGYRAAKVSVDAAERSITVQVDDREVAPEQIVRSVTQPGRVAFHRVHLESERLGPLIEASEAETPSGYELRDLIHEKDEGKTDREVILVRTEPAITSERLESAEAIVDTSGWGIGFTFDREGAQLFGELTDEMRPQDGRPGQRLAIIFDGEILSAPTIQTQIFERGQITGFFTKGEAQSLAKSLESPLPEGVTIIYSGQTAAETKQN